MIENKCLAKLAVEQAKIVLVRGPHSQSVTSNEAGVAVAPMKRQP
jgi:hypothetical protein